MEKNQEYFYVKKKAVLIMAILALAIGLLFFGNYIYGQYELVGSTQGYDYDGLNELYAYLTDNGITCSLRADYTVTEQKRHFAEENPDVERLQVPENGVVYTIYIRKSELGRANLLLARRHSEMSEQEAL